MCGIAGIVQKQKDRFNSLEKIMRMSALIAHRGPDGEGFIAFANDQVTPYSGRVKQSFEQSSVAYIPKAPIESAPASPLLAFAHRRLSIIDLSETGHQPMCSLNGNLWITYNGEVYNYVELKKDLEKLGHTFISGSDTEVILNAYAQWGPKCVEHFNGMWAFCIYDTASQTCFASRDRLGVKPFYYINRSDCFAFASEQKALTGTGLVKAGIEAKALHNYLVNGILESETVNFFDGITELWPGHNLFFDLKTNELSTRSYFHLKDIATLQNDSLSEKELIEKASQVLENAIALRLRSDVEVGTCLSGGIDSSVLAVTMAALTPHPVYCFTSVFSGQPFNEDKFASIVAEKIKGRHVKTEPSLDGFLKETDDLVYSQDAPIWSTSTYAQYKVMELAKINNIKVVLDGQGADELFAGYHHHFIAKWNDLVSHGKVAQALKDINASGKSIPKPFLFYLKEKLKQNYNPAQRNIDLFFKKDFVQSYTVRNAAKHLSSVNEQLLDDIYSTRLKTFLKCEDRCGMWHSVESRTPFSDDIELMKLMFSFSGNKKLKNGVSKYLLREAAKSRLPNEIYTRYDKKGFETPMQDWMLTIRPRMLAEIKNAGFDFVNYNKLERSNPANNSQNAILFKLFILSRWQKVFA